MLDESTHLDRKAPKMFHRTCKRRLGKHRTISWEAENTSVISKFCRVNFLKHMKVSMRGKNKPNSTIHPSTHLTFRHLEREKPRREKEGKMKERKTKQKNRGKEKRKEERKEARKEERGRERVFHT